MREIRSKLQMYPLAGLFFLIFFNRAFFIAEKGKKDFEPEKKKFKQGRKSNSIFYADKISFFISKAG